MPQTSSSVAQQMDVRFQGFLINGLRLQRRCKDDPAQ